MRKIYNLSAGPAILPTEVLEIVQKELLDYKNSGMSVLEISHRSEIFEEIIEAAEQNLRRLLKIGPNYKVLFLQGGASLQFVMAALNLKKEGKAAYVDTGNWSQKASKAAKEAGMEVEIIASSKNDDYTKIPEVPSIDSGYDYLHITSNNTIEGTQFKSYPDSKTVPLVADMSSDILSKPINVEQFGLIYAGAQKNMGPAGVTTVIIHEDLLGENSEIPSILEYKTHADKNSLYNTPPTFSIYVAKLVFDWLLKLGGLSAIEKINEEKSALLYDYLEHSQLFYSPVEKSSRSVMNIPFVTGDKELDELFIEKAEENNFKFIKGHRSVGGMRASFYNAFPLEGVEALVHFMNEFEKEHK